jgi:ribosomal protein S18 acetylase RimI-like enzyme
VLALWDSSRSPVSVTPDTPAAVEALIEHPASVLLVADDVIGTLVVGWDGWRGNMYRLAVAEDRRRRGIARALVEAGHEHLRSLGARRITALVGADDEEAASLWQAVGYSYDPHIKRFVRNV